jgi:hypothetical protein
MHHIIPHISVDLPNFGSAETRAAAKAVRDTQVRQKTRKATPTADVSDTGKNSNCLMFSTQSCTFGQNYWLGLLIVVFSGTLLTGMGTFLMRKGLIKGIKINKTPLELNGSPVAVGMGGLLGWGSVLLVLGVSSGFLAGPLAPGGSQTDIVISAMMCAGVYLLWQALVHRTRLMTLHAVQWTENHYGTSLSKTSDYLVRAFPTAAALFLGVILSEVSSLDSLVYLFITHPLRLLPLLLPIVVYTYTHIGMQRVLWDDFELGPLASDVHYTGIKKLLLGQTITVILTCAILVGGAAFGYMFIRMEEVATLGFSLSTIMIACFAAIMVLAYTVHRNLLRSIEAMHLIRNVHISEMYLVPEFGFVSMLMHNIGNTLLIVFTFGLALPWTSLRRVRFVLNHTKVAGNVPDWEKLPVVDGAFESKSSFSAPVIGL